MRARAFARAGRSDALWATSIAMWHLGVGSYGGGGDDGDGDASGRITEVG